MPSVPVGFAKVDITPPLDRFNVFGLGYWFARSVRFTGVRDPLFVRTVALGDQLIVSVDAIFDSFGFSSRATSRIARDPVVPEENVFITCTHTHSAPLLGLNNAEQGVEYGIYVEDRIVACALEALGNRRPMAVSLCRGQVADALYNRRPLLKNGSIAELHAPLDPDAVADPGPINDTMTILKFRYPGGEPAGAICHFGIHGVAIQCSDLISSDCMGRAIQRFEAETGTVMLHLNGPCGDIDPVAMGDCAALDTMTERLFAGIRSVNAAAERAVTTMPQRSMQGRFHARRRDVSPTDVLPDDHAQNFSHHSGAGYERFLLEEERALAGLPEQFDIPYQVLRSGELVWAGVGGEVFTCFGNRLASASRDSTIMPVGITGAWNGYLPPEEAFTQGGYEVARARWCPIAPGESEKLFQQIERDVREQIGTEDPRCLHAPS